MTASARVDITSVIVPARPVVASPVAHRLVWAAHPSRWRRIAGAVLLISGLCGAGATVLGLARNAGVVRWNALFGSPGWLSVVLVSVTVGYVCQSVTYAMLLPKRLSKQDRFLLPWACAAVNRVTPAGTGGLWLSTRVLRRRGVSVGGTALTLGSMSIGHTLGGLMIGATALITGGAAMPAGMSLPYLPSWLLPVLSSTVLLGLLGGSRLRRRAAAALREGRHEVSLRGLPAVLILQMGARLAPVIVLQSVLIAFGHPLPLATVVLVEVAAATSGAMIPLPGGGGGVELAGAALLVSSGVPFGTASAAILASRLLSFWLPGLVGVPALLALRKTCATIEAASELAHLAGQPPVPTALVVPAYAA